MRAGHSFLSGVYVVRSCFPISESQCAAESRTIASGAHASAYGTASDTAVYSAIRGAAFAAVGGAYRLNGAGCLRWPDGREPALNLSKGCPSLHYFCALLCVCACPQLNRRPTMHFT